MLTFIRAFCFSLCFGFIAEASSQAATSATLASQKTQRQAVEVTPRSGLPNVIQKLERGDSVTIGYFGGSITAAPGWRVKSLAWLQSQYPKASLKEINAAIGGTGSDLGAFRLNQDALQHHPDLLFVEFAVNDGGTDPIQIQKSMEGIVRQTWKRYPNTDICFVYTLSQPFLKDLQEGKISRSATAMEHVADHYQIPSIHFGLEIAALEKSGALVFAKPDSKSASLDSKPIIFSADGVHPFVETGHAFYLKAIQRAWPKLQGKTSAPHELPKPLHDDNWEDAKIVPIAPAMLSGDWELLDPKTESRAKSFQARLPQLWKAKSPGATLQFKFKGRAAFTYDLVGPDGGQLEILVDQAAPRKVARIDGYCTYHRLTKLDLISSPEEASHGLKITLLDEKLDKQKILFERNREDLQKHPEKYVDHVWHVGSLLILGDLIP